MIAEILKDKDDGEKCKDCHYLLLDLVKSNSGPRYVVGVRP